MSKNPIDVEKLKTLIEINALISSSYTDLNALLVYILESAMRLVNCESSSILLLDKNDTLRFEVALGPKGVEAKKIPVVREGSIAGWVVDNNKSLVLENAAQDSRFFSKVQNKTGYTTKNMIAVPMRVGQKCIGVIELLNKSDNLSFSKDDLEIIELLTNQASIAYQNASAYQMAQNEIQVLQHKLHVGPEFHTFVSESESIKDLLDVIEKVSQTNSSVLILGESGVGKELFAEQIHLRSARSSQPFVRVNCAALSASLLESELFGHVKGAFTDAISDRKGRFEVADGGTLFLDEIGELPLDLQAKLLRVIQSRSFERLGSSETLNVDVRIVAATNRDLESMVAEGKFRSDLYYRLNVLPIYVPPLRERVKDIEPLALFFLHKFCGETKKDFKGFSVDALTQLHQYSWPGNIRELENTIERACVLGKPPFIMADDLRLSVKKKDVDFDFAGDRSLKNALFQFKKMYVEQILQECNWNQTKAGKVLGIQRTYVSRLMNELGIR
ncbi:MAG: GAF domain-containing protein [Spirochaetaceae bacterium]|nr:GAF domain-containing protein [Spirochaetaceae bacterium]